MGQDKCTEHHGLYFNDQNTPTKISVLPKNKKKKKQGKCWEITIFFFFFLGFVGHLIISLLIAPEFAWTLKRLKGTLTGFATSKNP